MADVRGPGGHALHIGIDAGASATVVMPVGVLAVSTAPQLRDVLLRCIAEQPEAVIVDLNLTHIQSAQALVVFGQAASQSAEWTGVPLLLVSGPPVADRMNLHTGALTGNGTRNVGVYPTLRAARAALRRAPRRRVTRRRLPADSRAAPMARGIIRGACRSWNCDRATRDAEHIGTELASNAVQHAGTESVLRLEHRDHLLTVAVADDDPRPARLRPPSDHPGGYGLLIVSGLARDWSCVPTRTGKTVWATIATDPQQRPTHRA